VEIVGLLTHISGTKAPHGVLLSARLGAQNRAFCLLAPIAAPICAHCPAYQRPLRALLAPISGTNMAHSAIKMAR